MEHDFVVTFVINGEQVTVFINPSMLVKDAVREALTATENIGRSLDDWKAVYDDSPLQMAEMFSNQKRINKQGRAVGELVIEQGSLIFVSLKFAAIGNDK